MKSRLAAALAVLTLSATLASASPDAWRNGNGNRGSRGSTGAKITQQLNLTNEQKAQIKTIREETRAANAARFDGLRETRKELRAARAANDTARTQQLQATLDSLRAQMKQARDNERARILALLTPEQLTEWEKIEKAKNKHRGKRGKRD